MQFQASPPFELSKDADGAQHAVRAGLAITVTADLPATINHRVAQQPQTGNSARWLQIELDNGTHIYVDGQHVIVTGEDYRPTFDLLTDDQWLDRAFKHLRAEKDEKGRYVVDTESNRRVLKQLFERVELAQKNRLLAWVRHAMARFCD